MNFEFNVFTEENSVSKVCLNSPDDLVILTGNSGIGKSLTFELIEEFYIQATEKELNDSDMPRQYFLYSPIDDSHTPALIGKLKTMSSEGLIVIDDLDEVLSNCLHVKELLDSVINAKCKVIVICKRVPSSLKLPDRFFFNLVIKDGVATIEQILKEGLYGVVKNNYKL